METLAINAPIIQLVSELGTIATELGWLREAEIIGQAIRLVRPESTDPLVLHALVRIAGGHYESAIEFLNQVLTRDPTHPRASVFWAFAMLKDGRRHDAFVKLNQILESPEENDPHCVNFARELMRQEYS